MTPSDKHTWIGEKAALFEAAMLQGLVSRGTPLGNGIGKTTVFYNGGYGDQLTYIHEVALILAEQLYKAWNGPRPDTNPRPRLR